jgi:pyruvate/2-oxoglutarate dehydrogenase complex dihydrolipoamide dehydrogenase (E3) component
MFEEIQAESTTSKSVLKKLLISTVAVGGIYLFSSSSSIPIASVLHKSSFSTLNTGNNVVKIAIIGAGPSGTKLASLLNDIDGISVDIFDANDYVGGRTLSRYVTLSN